METRKIKPMPKLVSGPLANIKKGWIKCDNPACGFMADVENPEDFVNWINIPCPKCGKILFTEEDYNKQVKIVGVINAINQIGIAHPTIAKEYGLEGKEELLLSCEFGEDGIFFK